jgi:diguanylate cyclase (GGDEF)-like protein
MLDQIQLSFPIVVATLSTLAFGGMSVFTFFKFNQCQKINSENIKLKSVANYLDSNPNPVLRCDASGRLLYANSAAKIFLEEWTIDVGELLPEDIISVVEDVIQNDVIEEIEQLFNELLYVIKFCPAEDKSTVSIFALNISERMEVENELKQLTVYDQVTELPNKTLFLDRVNRDIEYAKKENKPFPLLVILMEDLKEIVDAFGQEMGDKLLRAASERFNQQISIDSTLGRVGDSEFGFIEKNISDPAEIANFVQEFYERCNSPFEIDGKVIVCDICIGIAVLSVSGETADDLLRNAVIAANRATNEHTDFEFYQKSMNQQVEARRTVVGEIHHALDQNQFVLFYQPQVVTTTGRAVGAEALIRWIHPERGLISPVVFIPAAEESGLIIPISEWVLFEACHQIAKWNKKGIKDIKIAVNVSAQQFMQTDLVSKVKEAIAESGIEAKQLELELTEGMVIKDLEKTIATMSELRNLGIGLAIDDFGTGYSSLSYLKRFPIQKLKVDRAFIKDITNAEDDTEITKGIIQLGHSLKLRIITEGVETEEQLAYLIKHQCDLIQGFYFSKPLPVDEFEAYILQNHSKTSD